MPNINRIFISLCLDKYSSKYMKELLLYPVRKIKYYWGGIAIMLIGGIVLNMPDFLFGVGIGVAILYIGLIIYKMMQ